MHRIIYTTAIDMREVEFTSRKEAIRFFSDCARRRDCVSAALHKRDAGNHWQPIATMSARPAEDNA